ncbi:MAG: PKD domain-containing protein [Prevotellaceae bacterium]|jgi:M6 family metalloprotease-like protein|nr:PKD domain-containing protein [Prevotellaceae bacterium]
MKKLFIFLSVLFLTANLNAAYVENYPVEIKQPDGTTVQLFATGDEYHHRIHDKEGYTLLCHPKTGWIVYAVLQDGELVPTDFLYGKINPHSVNIIPNLDISAEKRRQLYRQYWQNARKPVSQNEKPDKTQKIGRQNAPAETAALRTGTLNNIVIYISFPAPNNTFGHSKSDIETLFNNSTSGESLYSYYRDISNNTFNIQSAFFPQSSTTIFSYQALQPRSYYEENTDDDIRRAREHELLHDAIMSCKTEIEAAFTASQLDALDNDGYVDNISFIIQGSAGAWSALLWPHRWALYTYQPYYGNALYLNGKMVWDYLFVLDNGISQNTLIHEMYHCLGAPDLYTGGTDLGPVSSWDIMAYSHLTKPQSSTVYISKKYGKFVDDIPEILTSDTYTLYDSWDRNPAHPIAYKITSPTSTVGEYFVLEYRRKTGGMIYETGIPNSGIIISRIYENANNNDGNMGCDGTTDHPYEVYIYRQNGTNTVKGTIGNAYFSSTGRTVFSDSSSPSAFLSDNTAGLGGIVIDQFSAAGNETMTFRVTFPTAEIPVSTAATNIGRYGFTANWTPTTNTQNYLLSVYRKVAGVETYDGGGFIDNAVGNVTSFNVTGLNRSLSTTWYYKVKAISGGVPSAYSNEIEVALANYSPVACEYESNMLQMNLPAYYTSNGGALAGINNNSFTQYAEFYQLSDIAKVTSFTMNVCEFQNNSNDPDYAKITMKLWNKGSNNLPGTLLYSEDFSFTQIGGTGEKTFTFTTPVIVPTEFFIGYQIYKHSTNLDAFGVYVTTPRGIGGLNTAYVGTNDWWGAISSSFGSDFTNSLFLFPQVCTFTPAADFSADVTENCEKEKITFINSTQETQNMSYLWDFGDTNTSSEKNPQHVFETAQTYTVSLTAINDYGETTETDYITIHPLPKITYTVINETASNAGDGSIDLTISNGTSPYAFLWNNAAISEDLYGLSAGNYSITVTDAKGCEATENITVTGNYTALGEVSENPLEIAGYYTITGIKIEKPLDKGVFIVKYKNGKTKKIVK